MKHITHSNIRLICITFFALLFFTAPTLYSLAADTSSGFYTYRAASKGTTSACPAGHIRWEAVLKEYSSMTNITNFTGLELEIRTMNDNTDIEYNKKFNLATGEVPVVCVHHDSFIGVVVRDTGGSLYKEFRSARYYPTYATTRDKEIGKHIVGHVHLQRKSDSPKLISYLSPPQTARNTSPSYTVQLNAISTLYGANRVIYAATWTYLESINKWYRSTIPTSGTTGEYKQSAFNLPYDGFYKWEWDMTENGSAPLLGYDYIEQPSSGYTYNYFILDRVKPISSVTHTVTSSNTAGVDVDFVNKVKDPLSGLKATTLYIRNVTSGAPAVAVPTPFDVVAGEFSGPTDEYTATTSATLEYEKTYEYYATTVDVAGNVQVTSKTTFTTGPAPALPLTLTLKTDKAVVSSGGTAELTWEVTGASSCSTNGWLGSPNATDGTHTYDVTNITSSKEYTITCINGPQELTKKVSVSVNPPGITMTADPALIQKGETTEITWSVSPDTGVSDCTISGFDSGDTAVDSSGQITTDALTQQRKFTLTCTFDGTTITESVTVSVLPSIYET